jgi:murein DD-endopeptidase MepM/ murein hydrolase activator NlpD
MLPCPLQGPVRLTQHFGQHPEIYKQFGLKGHNGIDLTGPKAGALVPVHAPYDAEVYEVGDQGKKGYGKFIRLRTAANKKGVRREIVLAHLSLVSVKPGQEVSLGDAIGIMGNTGFSTGPHVHLGLRRVADGKIIDYNNGYMGYVDFEKYLQFWADPATLVTYPYG